MYSRMYKAMRALAATGMVTIMMIACAAWTGGVYANSPFEQNVNAEKVGYRHNGGYDYEVEEPMGSGTWKRVYCLDQAKTFTDSAKWNLNYRWRTDLWRNAEIINLNENGVPDTGDSGVAGSHKPDETMLGRLVSILWQAEQLNAGIDDTQNAVWWFVTEGGVDDYAGSTSEHYNHIVKAAGDSGWATPQDFRLYIYSGGTTANYGEWWQVQNTVRLEMSPQPEEPEEPAKPEEPTKPEEPAKPDEPGKPDTPTTPEQPKPGQPTQPGTAASDQPTTPADEPSTSAVTPPVNNLKGTVDEEKDAAVEPKEEKTDGDVKAVEVVESTEPGDKTAVKSETETKGVDTGDETPLVIAGLILALLTAGGAFEVMRRRRNG